MISEVRIVSESQLLHFAFLKILTCHSELQIAVLSESRSLHQSYYVLTCQPRKIVPPLLKIPIDRNPCDAM